MAMEGFFHGQLASEGAAEARHLQLAEDCLILAGPTASGKTAIAIPLAKRLGAEIVSVDSMAVYRNLTIGTAKPSLAQRQRVPHHCIDLVHPSEPFSVAAWLLEAARAVEAVRSRGRRVLFVGGTPLYLKALRDGLAEAPAADPAIREALSLRLQQEGSAALHRELAAVDPEAAERVHPHDGRRIIRGLEVASMAHKPSAPQRAATWRTSTANASAATMLIVDVPRRLLADRIAARVRQMFADGFVEEVQAAQADGGIGTTAGQAAGYGEVLAMLAGRLSLAEAIDHTIRRTRQLAKRQRTWFRSFRNAVWICS
jgi:tRNA dimethylallyltransferase